MSFADARAAAFATFIKRYEPQWPTSRRFNDQLRYEERCEIFEAVKEILSNPAVDRDKPVWPVLEAVAQRRRVDKEAVWRYVRRWYDYKPMTTRARVLVAWREFIVRRRIPVINHTVALTPDLEKEFEAIKLKKTGEKQLDLNLRRRP
jgi:hypothetical protein